MSQTENSASSKKGIPFSLQIVIAVILALVVGILLGAGDPNPELIPLIKNLKVPTELFFKALTALAAPLIFLLLLETLIKEKISGEQGKKLVVFIMQNTLVAIGIGLLIGTVFTILSPGNFVNLGQVAQPLASKPNRGFLEIIIEHLTPEALLKPLIDNNFISLVLIALGFGFVLRGIKIEQEYLGKRSFQSLEKIIKVLSKAIERILKWLITLLPMAVFGVVANTTAEKGFTPFISFGALILAVLSALFLQACYYLVRIKFQSSVNPLDFLRKGSKAFTFAFSTASSALTMPIAREALVNKIRLRKNSVSLGVYLGGSISKDAVAIFQVLFTLFVAQILGQSLTPVEYLILFLLSIFSSVCTVGVPGSAIVLMKFVFSIVFTNPESAIYIDLLLSIYWFLDMFATVINVMSYMTVSTLLDAKQKG
ncbi:MAG: cation:dicarboxylase symporter family transporter [Cyanobacteria bacterium J06635_10]